MPSKMSHQLCADGRSRRILRYAPRVTWHLRYIRKLIYTVLALTITAILVSSLLQSPDWVQVWVSAREAYGLGALTFLLASMLAGPLSFVLPWLPVRAHLILGRRALGVSAFVLAVTHVICYLGPTIYWDWRALYTPGGSWVTGLVLGTVLFVNMGVLAFTSRNDAVRWLGPKRWKKWHKSVYFILPATLIHAVFLGVDFGANRGPDVKAEADAGSLIARSEERRVGK